MGYIEFKNIVKNYGNIKVLKNVNLDIEKGELVTLLGPSGCGKSTLLRCLAGLEEVTSGNIMLAGKDITNVSPREREIGMVFQQYSLFPNMTVAQNVAFGLKMKKDFPPAIKEKVRDMIDVVGLKGQENKYPSQLSGGQQQRVALARAIVTEPKVLLLDEPLSAIDALLRRNLQVEIRRLHKEFGMTTIFVTHDQEEAMVMSDTVNLLYNGNLEQSGSPVDVYTRPATEFAANFIGHYNFMKASEFGNMVGERFDCESVAFRPEIIKLSKEPKDTNEYYVVEGKVLSCMSHGNIMRYTVKSGENVTDVDALYTANLKFYEGDRAYMNITKSECIKY